MLYDDVTLSRVIQRAKSLEEAASLLGVSKTWTRRQADRLGVRTQFRYGVERLPDDARLKRMLADAGRGRGAEELARRLGVTVALILEEGERLGVDPRRRTRAGLPDDATLKRELETCARFTDLARRYAVAPHTIRNQAKRLGVPSPTMRGRV
ncbi:hypothetical protein PUR29_33215 [Methylobacterium ajmalii]|uniref:Uncharacterized protein n=1 Tax=Methylobacterium ajmalii TaxID=2738439 RepID=A0ABV0A575_9HYPH